MQIIKYLRLLSAPFLLLFLSFPAVAKESYVMWILGQNEANQISLISEILSSLQNPETIKEFASSRASGIVPLPKIAYPSVHSNPGEVLKNSEGSDQIRRITSEDGTLKAYVYEVDANLTLTFAIPGQVSTPYQTLQANSEQLTEVLQSLGASSITHQVALLFNLNLDELQPEAQSGFLANWRNYQIYNFSQIEKQAENLNDTIQIIESLPGKKIQKQIILFPSEEMTQAETSLQSVSQLHKTISQSPQIQETITKSIKKHILDIEQHNIQFEVTDWNLIYDSKKSSATGLNSYFTTKQNFDSAAEIIKSTAIHAMNSFQKEYPNPILYRETIKSKFSTINPYFKKSFERYKQTKEDLHAETQTIQSQIDSLDDQLVRLENNSKRVTYGQPSQVKFMNFKDASNPTQSWAMFSTKKEYENLEFSNDFLIFGADKKGTSGAQVIQDNAKYKVTSESPDFLLEEQSGFYSNSKTNQIHQFQTLKTQFNSDSTENYTVQFELIASHENDLATGIFDGAEETYQPLHTRGLLGSLNSYGKMYAIGNESFEVRDGEQISVDIPENTILASKKGRMNFVEFAVSEGMSDNLCSLTSEMKSRKDKTGDQLSELKNLESSFNFDLGKFLKHYDEDTFNYFKDYELSNEETSLITRAESTIAEYDLKKRKFRNFQVKYRKNHVSAKMTPIQRNLLTSKMDLKGMVSDDVHNKLDNILESLENGTLVTRVQGNKITYIATEASVLHDVMNMMFIPKYHQVKCVECSTSKEFEKNFEIEPPRKTTQESSDELQNTRKLNLAVIGPAGSGKSTLINTLNHFASTLSVDALEMIDASESSSSFITDETLADSWTQEYLPDNFDVGTLRAQCPAFYSNEEQNVTLCGYLPNKKQIHTETKGHFVDSFLTTRSDISPAYRIISIDTKGYQSRHDPLALNKNPSHINALNKMKSDLDGLILVVDGKRIMKNDTDYIRALTHDIANINEIRKNQFPIFTVITRLEFLSEEDRSYVYMILDNLIKHEDDLDKNSLYFFFKFGLLWKQNCNDIDNEDYSQNLHESIRLLEAVRHENTSVSMNDFLAQYSKLIASKKSYLEIDFSKNNLILKKDMVDTKEPPSDKIALYSDNNSPKLQMIHISLDENRNPKFSDKKHLNIFSNKIDRNSLEFKDLYDNENLSKFKDKMYNNISRSISNKLYDTSKFDFSDTHEHRDLILIGNGQSGNSSHAKYWYKSWYGKLYDDSEKFDVNFMDVFSKSFKGKNDSDINSLKEFESRFKDHKYILIFSRQTFVNPGNENEKHTYYKLVDIIFNDEENFHNIDISTYLY